MKLVFLFLFTQLFSSNLNAGICLKDLSAYLTAVKQAKKELAASSNLSSFEKKALKRVEDLKNQELMGQWEADSFKKTLVAFRKSTNSSLLNTGVTECFDKYSIKGLSNIVKLIYPLRFIKKGESPFKTLTKRSQVLYGDTPQFAKKRICSLAQSNHFQTGKCSLFKNFKECR
jgi:hypothetical protein